MVWRLSLVPKGSDGMRRQWATPKNAIAWAYCTPWLRILCWFFSSILSLLYLLSALCSLHIHRHLWPCISSSTRHHCSDSRGNCGRRDGNNNLIIDDGFAPIHHDNWCMHAGLCAAHVGGGMARPTAAIKHRGPSLRMAVSVQQTSRENK